MKEMVAPSQLWQELKKAEREGGPDERRQAIALILDSGNLAVIRRIPDRLAPLSDEERGMAIKWAEGFAENEDVSNRDFAFHFLVNCGAPTSRVLEILERNRTMSRSALEHIQQLLEGGEGKEKLDTYLHEVAETLIRNEDARSRDRGRHMLMTLATSEVDWIQLSGRFSVAEKEDLRQRVMERFLRDCPVGAALEAFAVKVICMCTEAVKQAQPADVHKEASHMHWALTCAETIKSRPLLVEAAKLFRTKFGKALPRSVQYRVDAILKHKP